MRRPQLAGSLVLRHYVLSISAVAALLAGCGGSQPPIGAPGAMPQTASASQVRSQGRIQHIVVLVQERRTFNDLFATTKVGCEIVGRGKHAKRVNVPLKQVDLAGTPYMHDNYTSYVTAYDQGTMCGFNLIGDPSDRYEYVNPAYIRPYRKAVAEYALADRMFQTQGGGDFTAHQDLIRGGTEISSTASVVDSPIPEPWGCPAPLRTKTDLITTNLKYEYQKGPFPCFSYKTLQMLLDAKSISWAYYTPSVVRAPNWDAFLAIKAVWESPHERSHIVTPETTIFGDITKGKLPSMSWVAPDLDNSDSPGAKVDHGPAWVASVVDAIGHSTYWKSTATVIVWDDWGGFYDPIPPPFINKQGGAGFRVPMIVVSAYVPRGELSHTVYGFGSIVRFIEDTWKLGRLETTDKTSTSIGDMFDFNQEPREFVGI